MADSSTPISDAEAPPQRGSLHEALSVFLGDWRAEGSSYGSPDQDPDDPKGKPEAWTSTHTAHWHTGEFFLIQDERAIVGGKAFDTLGYMGVDPATGRYFSQSIENHGFERRYEMSVNGNVWKMSGEHERATITFSQDGRTQDIKWEWKPSGVWLPLCDRTAHRIVSGQARA
ncbi:MAG: DUF1579 domain-containing protein [Burkholderiales bacterium]|nr:MAG: DUF1579 domain-containing protein [Burkholderiales bacterium]